MAGIHETAAAGFGGAANEYERGRPSYPDAAVAHIVTTFGIAAGATVVDVGAGTGKFTRLLVPSGARVVGVEPVAQMRAVFETAVPAVEIVDGTAEAIPVGDGEVDAVVAAQTFHWVDAVPAVAELHRVLRRGGGVALLWNSRDRSVDWTRRLQELMAELAGEAPRYGSASGGGWQRAIANHQGFTPIDRAEFRLDHPTTKEATIARVASTSYVSVLPADRKREVLQFVDDLVSPLGESFVEPYVTEVFTCRKR